MPVTNGGQDARPPLTDEEQEVVISFVIIGYNEAKTLATCLRSVQEAARIIGPMEILYVDGGSEDNSLLIAEAASVDHILGGDKRRKAAENRNLGLAHARGRYVQFVDGDMTLDATWPKAAQAFLEQHPEVAVVCGKIVEKKTGPLSETLELDWKSADGPVRYCGGAAFYRREPLVQLGGFSEDLAYGEEPYLCWRIRNELGLTVYQLDRPMVQHDLGLGGFRDYWRRCVRCGATYAEVAARCFHSHEQLWLKEVLSSLLWSVLILGAGVTLLLGDPRLRLVVVVAGCVVLGRKLMQVRAGGRSPEVSALYACHVYFSKLPIAVGVLRWWTLRLIHRRKGLKS